MIQFYQKTSAHINCYQQLDLLNFPYSLIKACQKDESHRTLQRRIQTKVTDGQVDKTGFSATSDVLSWSSGYGFEPKSGWTWGAWYFCPNCHIWTLQKYCAFNFLYAWCMRRNAFYGYHFGTPQSQISMPSIGTIFRCNVLARLDQFLWNTFVNKCRCNTFKTYIWYVLLCCSKCPVIILPVKIE